MKASPSAEPDKPWKFLLPEAAPAAPDQRPQTWKLGSPGNQIPDGSGAPQQQEPDKIGSFHTGWSKNTQKRPGSFSVGPNEQPTCGENFQMSKYSSTKEQLSNLTNLSRGLGVFQSAPGNAPPSGSALPGLLLRENKTTDQKVGVREAAHLLPPWGEAAPAEPKSQPLSSSAHPW